MLRIAVPNKGMLSEPAWNMLAEAGYRLRTNPRQLVVQDPDNGIELFYLRPLDIAVYVGRGAIDVGITGQDLLKNSGTAALEHMPLGFGTSTFRFAAPNESPITTLEDVQGKRVATINGGPGRADDRVDTLWRTQVGPAFDAILDELEL